MFNKISILTLIPFLCFSFIECNHKILDSETIIHLKLFNNFLDLYEKESPSKEIRFKVWSINLTLNKQTDEDIEIFILNEKDNHFVRQQQFGHLYNSKEFVLLSINTTNIEKDSFVIEFYERETQNWRAFAFSHLLPFLNKQTDGQLTLPVLTQNNKLLGHILVDYLIIRPIKDLNTNADKMIDIKSPAMMGHRGTGVGRRTDLKENILENTIQAFNYACLHNADMIELDIQLSKDKIPIIHHDFSAKLLTEEKIGNNFYVTEVPVKDLTYQQMTKISTLENKHFDYEDNQPFETLESVLRKVEPKCGINFEIKYPQQTYDGTWNGVKGLELNEYIDIIVKSLYENIGNRSGIITSFHPDLCAMIHLKQNKFRVALLTSGDVKHWNPRANPYLDPRATTILLNTYFAEGMQLNGLSIYAKDLIANTSLIEFVKSYNQSLYIWGDQLNNTKTLDFLIKKGVDGLIFDRIDKLLHKTDPEFSDQSSGNKVIKSIPIITLISFIITMKL